MSPTSQVDYSAYSRGAAVDVYGWQQQQQQQKATGVSMAEASTQFAASNPQQYSTGMCSAAAAAATAGAGGHSQQVADAYAGYDPAVFAGLPPHMLDGATNFTQGEGRVVSERLVETKQEFIAGVPRDMFHSNEAADREAIRAVLDRMNDGGVAVAGVRPIYMMEKVVEVPHIITKEYDKHVPKPEILERLIEVPRTEIRERTVQLPPTVQYQEQIVEVPEVVIEERVVHVPKKEIQERLIEVPKVKYVERIEYEDIIEYREVPVDRIVEVPEIEYRVREVEQLVPQEYIQEYYVDRYKEVPVTQIQEVERIEHIPVTVPPGYQAPVAAQFPSAQFPSATNLASAPSMPQAVKVSAAGASTMAPPAGASSLVSASFPANAFGSTASVASAPGGPAGALPVPVPMDPLHSMGSVNGGGGGPPTPPIPVSYSGPCGGSVSVPPAAAASMAYTGPCGGSVSVPPAAASMQQTAPSPFASSPPGAGLPPPGSSPAANLPVGSSFLVPRGTFPRGQMSAMQAAQAGLSMPPASGAFPPMSTTGPAASMPPPSMPGAMSVGASIPSTMGAAASMPPPSMPGGYNPYDSALEPNPHAVGFPPLMSAQLPMTQPPMMTMSQPPPLASAPFASAANPFQTGGAYPSYANMQAPVPAMA